MTLPRDNVSQAACGTTGYQPSEHQLEKLRDIENFSEKKSTALKTPAKPTETLEVGGSAQESSESREKQCKKHK